jgi:hypothetical protein
MKGSWSDHDDGKTALEALFYLGRITVIVAVRLESLREIARAAAVPGDRRSGHPGCYDAHVVGARSLR